MPIHHWEVREDPDDLPVIFRYSLADAERYARKRADRTGAPQLIYEVDERGERFIGEA